MAKLYGRVSQLSNPELKTRLTACLAMMLGISVSASPIQAQESGEAPVAQAGDPVLERLEELSTALASAESAERARAFEGLTTLGADALPAIRARLDDLARPRPPANWTRDLLNRFHARGSDEEGTDLARGALIELGRAHPNRRERRYALQLAEPLLLWRSLESMGTAEADRVAFRIIALDEGRWLPEARNWVRRRGVHVMAATLMGRAHSSRFVRRWARWATDELGTDNPGRVLPRLETDQLRIDVMRAYSALRVQSAMRVIVSYVGSERRGIRRAAREAMERYGGNGIWVLRTAYRNHTREAPPRGWGWRRVSRELYERADARRLAAVRTSLEAGLEARARGDLEDMRARFDEVLAQTPEIEDGEDIAEGYAAFAIMAQGDGRFDEAADALRRAERLAPEHPERGTWQTALRFGELGAMRRDGLNDVNGLAQLAEDGAHAPARAQLQRLRRPAEVRPGSEDRTWALWLAALLALFGATLFWRPSDANRAGAETDESGNELGLAYDATAQAPGFDEADATWADQTLPG